MLPGSDPRVEVNRVGECGGLEQVVVEARGGILALWCIEEDADDCWGYNVCLEVAEGRNGAMHLFQEGTQCSPVASPYVSSAYRHTLSASSGVPAGGTVTCTAWLGH